MPLLRQPILLLSRSRRVRDLVSRLPVTAGIVTSYVPGEGVEAAVRAAADLVGDGLMVTLDHLGEHTTDRAQASANVAAYKDLLGRIFDAGLATRAEVSIKLSALGQALPRGADGRSGDDVALDNAREICRAARNVGTAVTVDMEDHTTTDSTLAIVNELRKDFPETGAVLQAMLHRTEADCRQLAHEGSRVRLCKGAYMEPDEVAFQDRLDVDRSYVRCLKVLMAGQGHPMVATHDPRLIQIASTLASRHGRQPGTYEFQMLYGVRPAEQRRIAAAGETMRVYVPYGAQWYGYLMRRMAEKPQNLALFVRSLFSQK
jgi:proline dehydrogenase